MPGAGSGKKYVRENFPTPKQATKAELDAAIRKHGVIDQRSGRWMSHAVEDPRLTSRELPPSKRKTVKVYK